MNGPSQKIDKFTATYWDDDDDHQKIVNDGYQSLKVQ